MSTVAPLLNPQIFTPAHRDALAYIQNLAMTISTQGVYAVNVEYVGHTHQLEVRVYSRADLKAYRFQAINTYRMLLPGYMAYWYEDVTLCMPQLQQITRELEALLTPPTGDEAA